MRCLWLTCQNKLLKYKPDPSCTQATCVYFEFCQLNSFLMLICITFRLYFFGKIWELRLYPKCTWIFSWSPSVCLVRLANWMLSPPDPAVWWLHVIKTRRKQKSQFDWLHWQCDTLNESGNRAQAAFYHLIYEEMLQRHGYAGAWQERFALWSRVTLSLSTVLK